MTLAATQNNFENSSLWVPLVEEHPLVRELDATATRVETPLHAGSIVWRKWGSGPPLVLFHGGSGSWSHWIRNIPVLARDFTVWVIDLPGMGNSSWFSGDELELHAGETSDFTVPIEPEWQPPPIPMPALSRVLAQAIETIIPDEQINLVGFSFGGMTAANVAARIPHKIRRIVLVGAAGLVGRAPEMKPLLTWRLARDEAELTDIQRTNVGILMIHDPAKVDDLAVNIQVTNGQRTLSRKTRRHLTTIAALEQARVPISGIWGRFDAVSWWKIDHIRDEFRRIDPAAKFHVVEDGGHWVAYECADEFNRVLTQMLKA
jgi:pimeloyl-ACP methyl ester carboxylesterase